MTKTVQQQKLKRTWLVQRLNQPHPGTSVFGKDNPFAFGGGLRNGGLTDDAMNLLREIFSFDYMGAAEFEFGAVPEALQGLARDQKQLTTATVHIDPATLPKPWVRRGEQEQPRRTEATVYVLARKAHLRAVSDVVKALAAKHYQLKESTHLPRTLWPQSRFDGETVGWLELDNGFFFFTDRTMWEQTCQLFEVIP